MVRFKISQFLVLIAFGTTISCTNEFQEEMQLSSKSMSSIKTNSLDKNVVITDKGEFITIDDPTVYNVDLSEISESETFIADDWTTSITRSSYDSYPKKITVKGFDKKEQFGGYKKVSFKYADKYGLKPGTIYLVCFHKIFKDLAQSDNESIRPRDYAKNPDDTAMGWLIDEYNTSGKFVKGFSCTTNDVNGFVTASTLLRYVKCDLSGASCNVYIPYAPQNLVWQYVLNLSESWD